MRARVPPFLLARQQCCLYSHAGLLLCPWLNEVMALPCQSNGRASTPLRVMTGVAHRGLSHSPFPNWLGQRLAPRDPGNPWLYLAGFCQASGLELWRTSCSSFPLSSSPCLQNLHVLFLSSPEDIYDDSDKGVPASAVMTRLK